MAIFGLSILAVEECGMSSALLHYILFNPITLEGRLGTTDDFATIPFHLGLFSAASYSLSYYCALYLSSLLNQKTMRHGQTTLVSIS